MPQRKNNWREGVGMAGSLADLRDALEIACIDAVGGDTYGPHLARRLERDCRAILLQRGIPRARVLAQSDHRGTFVRVILPPKVARVGEIVIRLGAH
jgi:hypothetical protein